MMIDAALRYAERGWKVFPLAYGSKKPTEGSRGLHDATTNKQQISEWWQTDPTLNIGIATGQESNLTVIDIDGQTGLDSYATIVSQFPKQQTRVVKTPKGHHLYFQYNEEFHTGAGFLDGLDVRTNGGYVVAPPSMVNDQQYYVVKNRDINPIPISVAPDVFKSHSRNGVNPGLQPALTDNADGWIVEALKGVGEGKRNYTATRLAGYLHGNLNLSRDIIRGFLVPWADRCTPPYSIRELDQTINAVMQYEVQETKINLAESVKEWVMKTSGWWTTDELDKEMDLRDSKARANRSKILERLKAQGVVEQHQTVNKRFRYRSTQVEGLNYKQSVRGSVLDIQWPMGVEKYVNLYEGNIVVVAGSPNSGKTAMMLNLIHLNQDRFPVYYFCSEMGETELGDRLSYFEQEGRQLEDWTFEAINRATNFADVIRPDCINIIDFLELTQDIYLVNQYLTAITHAIGKGVAIIAIQKKVGASLGRGQEFSLEKPRLYLSMDTNRLTILKGKNWTQRNLNPNGLFINYRIEDGYRFVPTSDWNWAS